MQALKLPPPCTGVGPCVLAGDVVERVRLELNRAVAQSDAATHFAGELEFAFTECGMPPMPFVERLQIANDTVVSSLAGEEFRSRLQEFLSERQRPVNQTTAMVC